QLRIDGARALADGGAEPVERPRHALQVLADGGTAAGAALVRLAPLRRVGEQIFVAGLDVLDAPIELGAGRRGAHARSLFMFGSPRASPGQGRGPRWPAYSARVAPPGGTARVKCSVSGRGAK